MRVLACLSQVLAPTCSGPDPLDSIDKWKEQVKSYGLVACESLPNSVKVAVLLQAMQEPLRTLLPVRVVPKPALEDLLAIIAN